MKGTLLLLASLAAVAALAVWFAPVKVLLDGKTLSTRGIVQNGQVYVPAADVAKALGKTYAFDKKANVAKLSGGSSAANPGPGTPAGGADPSAGVDGKAGDVLFNGITRLTVGTELRVGDPYTTLEIEARNAEKVAKNYKFGFTSTRYTLFDSAGVAIEGEMKNNDHYVVELAQAEFRVVKVSFKLPPDYRPARLVVRLSTQVYGHPQKEEVFRVTF